jgi:hypothetical protein
MTIFENACLTGGAIPEKLPRQAANNKKMPGKA